MAYNNLIGELMSGMITASEASHGICDLVSMEIENMHNIEPMFATYAGPILKHFQGSCKCAVKNVIHFCKSLLNVRVTFSSFCFAEPPVLLKQSSA